MFDSLFDIVFGVVSHPVDTELAKRRLDEWKRATASLFRYFAICLWILGVLRCIILMGDPTFPERYIKATPLLLVFGCLTVRAVLCSPGNYARQDSAEHFFGSHALQCTRQLHPRILILA